MLLFSEPRIFRGFEGLVQERWKNKIPYLGNIFRGESSYDVVKLGLWDSNILSGKLCLYLGEQANQSRGSVGQNGRIFRLTALVAIVRSRGHQYSIWTIYYEFDWLGLLGQTDKSCPSGLLNGLTITIFIGNNAWECYDIWRKRSRYYRSEISLSEALFKHF